jgi:hypothetical protein
MSGAASQAICAMWCAGAGAESRLAMINRVASGSIEFKSYERYIHELK